MACPDARLDEEAEVLLRVEVVVLDVVADVGLHVDGDTELVEEGLLDGVAVRALEEHGGDAGHALAAAGDELAPQVGAVERLEQLEVHLAHVHLGPAEGVLDVLAAELGVVVDGGHVVEDLPGRPAEGPVVALHGAVEVLDRERDLGDGVAQAGHPDRQVVGLLHDPSCACALDRERCQTADWPPSTTSVVPMQ